MLLLVEIHGDVDGGTVFIIHFVIGEGEFLLVESFDFGSPRVIFNRHGQSVALDGVGAFAILTERINRHGLVGIEGEDDTSQEVSEGIRGNGLDGGAFPSANNEILIALFAGGESCHCGHKADNSQDLKNVFHN